MRTETPRSSATSCWLNLSNFGILRMSRQRLGKLLIVPRSFLIYCSVSSRSRDSLWMALRLSSAYWLALLTELLYSSIKRFLAVVNNTDLNWWAVVLLSGSRTKLLWPCKEKSNLKASDYVNYYAKERLQWNEKLKTTYLMTCFGQKINGSSSYQLLFFPMIWRKSIPRYWNIGRKYFNETYGSV